MKRKTDDMQRKIDASVTKRGQAEATRYLQHRQQGTLMSEIPAALLLAVILTSVTVILLSL